MSDDVNCQEVSRMISDGLDKTMDPRARARLRLHFVMCQTCRDVEAQMAFLRRAMQRMDKDDPLRD